MSKKDFIANLVKNKADLIDLKKSATKYADAFGSNLLQIEA